jgi:hypothetical protein
MVTIPFSQERNTTRRQYMNRLAQIMHDHAGRVGFGLGALAGCFAIVLSLLGKAFLSL